MKTKLLLFSLLPILAFSQTVGKINAEITAGVNIVQQNEMSFGKIISVGESTVTMTPQGARTTEGSVQVSGEAFGANTFYIQGAPNTSFLLTLPTSSTMTNGKTTLTVNAFTSSLTYNRGTTNNVGFIQFAVGCTLNIPSNVTSGVYLGTYNLTAVYQ
jgi:hypothetical protein